MEGGAVVVLRGSWSGGTGRCGIGSDWAGAGSDDEQDETSFAPGIRVRR